MNNLKSNVLILTITLLSAAFILAAIQQHNPQPKSCETKVLSGGKNE